MRNTLTQEDVVNKHNEAMAMIKDNHKVLGEKKFSRMWDLLWDRTTRLRKLANS